LSTDGKHTVHVSADSPEQLNQLAPHAMRLYDAVIKSYGTKAEMWQEVVNGMANGANTPKVGQRIDTPEATAQTEAPKCPMHDKPMVYREGKFGAFWSCHVRKPDGSWCRITKEADEPEASPALTA
jgi:hypothetical protein